jgi:hypothetical protein
MASPEILIPLFLQTWYYLSRKKYNETVKNVQLFKPVWQFNGIAI